MNMFCFQCEETAKGTGCTKGGVCGKTPQTAKLQDDIIAALIIMAKTIKNPTPVMDELMMDSLFMTLTNVNFDNDVLTAKLNEIMSIVKEAGNTEELNSAQLWEGDEDIRSLRTTLLLGVKGMAAYAHHAHALGYEDKEVTQWLYTAMAAIGTDHSTEEWLGLLMDCGKVNYKCMALLDKANTTTYGTPIPTEVPFMIEKGPFIVVTGHDLKDLAELLKQSEGKGVNIYTHSDMLPCHGYPELKKYPHFKGNYGTAWCNQRKEFDGIPAPILYTTNCIQRPKDSYLDRIYTTSIVGFPNTKHIKEDATGNKDFTAIINHAIKLGGYEKPQMRTGMNNGATVTTGFGHGTILSVADQVVDAVKAKAISHFFLVGGCDGGKASRDYYTEFVKETPEDSLILTLACGKFRFNDLDLGKIGNFPRIMDMGQCNDAYGAIQVALALADAFDCGVNDLPLTLVLSWYEQKAICIVLTLLSLGVKNIYVGPSIPGFFSPNVLNILVENFGLTPISTPKEDLEKILA
ncbi:MAG: hydroxylamine reductase [Clostridiales bacterium]